MRRRSVASGMAAMGSVGVVAGAGRKARSATTAVG